MSDVVIDSLGWLGSLLLITAYWLNSRNKINAQSSFYQTLNIFGSALLMANTVYYGAYPSSSVNVIWLFMGIYHISKILNKKKKTV